MRHISGWATLVLCLLQLEVRDAAEPLRPLCSAAADSCELTLEATYEYTMVLSDVTALGEGWVPVDAYPGGLYLKGVDEDCGIQGDKLTEEESSRVIVGDGTHRMVYAINGTIPAPPIVVYAGQQVILHFRNRLENEATTIHFHGMHQRGTPFMDGSGGVSQCPISPGETFTYRFKADPIGTHWYHAHMGSQLSMGLNGALIILPRNKEEAEQNRGDDLLPEFAAEYSMVIQDWHDRPASEVGIIATGGESIYNNGYESDECFVPTMEADGVKVSLWPYLSGVINGKGRRYTAGKVEKPDVPLEVFPVVKGGKYYFRVVCSSMNYAFSISIDGHRLHVVTSDGHDIMTQTVDSVTVAPGERYDFWIDATDPQSEGNYWIRAETLERMQNGQPIFPGHVDAILRYDDAPDQDPTSDRRHCSEFNPCRTLNSPFQALPPGSHTTCVNIGDLRATKSDDSTWQEEDEGVMEYFLGMKVTPVRPSLGYSPTINSIKNIMPPIPPQIFKDRFEDAVISCDPDLCEGGCACTHVVKLPLGKIVHLILFSDAGTTDFSRSSPHPMHIHGYTPQVVKVGYPTYDPETRLLVRGTNDIHCASDKCHKGARWADPTWANGGIPSMVGPGAVKKDTVALPVGGYIVLRFRADNPGFWYFHCHMDLHLMRGMSLVLQVGEPSDMSPAPARMARCGDFALDEDEYYEAIDYARNELPEKVVEADRAYLKEVTHGRMGSVPNLDIAKSSDNTASPKEHPSIHAYQLAVWLLTIACTLLLVALVVVYKRYAPRQGYLTLDIDSSMSDTSI